MKHQITDEEMRRFLKMQEFSLEFDQVIADGQESWVDSKGVIRTFLEGIVNGWSINRSLRAAFTWNCGRMGRNGLPCKTCRSLSGALSLPASLQIAGSHQNPNQARQGQKRESMSDSKFTSFLKHVGSEFKKGLDIFLPIASAVSTGISIVNPALGGLIHTSIATIMNVEQKFAASGQQSGTGTQKLADAVSILYPAFEAEFAQYGVKIDNTHVENYISALVAVLNAFPHVELKGAPAVPQA